MEQLQVVVKQLIGRTEKEVSVSIDVPNFRERRSANDMFQSEPFFTIPSGYKIKFIVYCSGHGDGEGTHLSVYTQLLDVPYHDHLQWPFRGTVSVKLSLIITTVRPNLVVGYFMFSFFIFPARSCIYVGHVMHCLYDQQ